MPLGVLSGAGQKLGVVVAPCVLSAWLLAGCGARVDTSSSGGALRESADASVVVSQVTPQNQLLPHGYAGALTP